ncbi:MAG: NADH-quinone oxidoreductase subunit L [Dehalococcoidia bacterium]|nr:NADH-quinone oxidoreductase subunit L [Dehalococcoidia bacterium]
MIGEAAAWLIVFLPIAAFALIALARPFAGGGARVSGYAAIAAIGAAFALSIWALRSTLGHEEAVGFASHSWFVVGDPGAGRGFEMTVGFLLDPLTGIMLVVVTGVSLLVQVYSQAYLKGDASYSRYFAYMALFTGSMLGLVTARNLIQLFVFWELVGLSSYLLIGFWHGRPAAADAAKKAFIVTRVGDFGFLLALLYLFAQGPAFAAQGLNPFEIPDLMAFAPSLAGSVAAWLALGLFAGAVGKSAQFPLHTWLPDAMEGPTPVSSLIHAATMVAAGVFLVARAFPLFEAGGGAALNTVALIGGVTALMAASMALVANDIKRVLAYSTISQLGFMFVALGAGLPAVAMFHLFTHAFFKCLLFLSAGSVHHAAHTFDMRYMGGLRKAMPWTYAAALIGALSLAGVFPLAGFWSKDEVLAGAWAGGYAASLGVAQAVFWMCVAASAMTAFYAFRMIYMTFHGEFRGGIDAVPAAEKQPYEEGEHVHLHESPWVMLLPMLLLAAAAIGAGYLGNATTDVLGIPAHWFAATLHHKAGDVHIGVAVLSSVVAAGGIGLATLMYVRGVSFPAPVEAALRPLGALLRNRYYLDHLYEGLLVRRIAYRGIFLAADWWDRRVVDGAADLTAWLGRNTGRALAQLQTGQAQAYGIAAALGAAAFILAYAVVR